MATLVSKADANITDANGWNTIETGTGAKKTTKTNTTSVTGTTYVYGSAFTDTNLNVSDGILLYLKRNGTSGTITVAYSQDNGVTDTKNLTVNASDLPVDFSWCFFKWGTTLTLDGGADNKVGIKCSSGGSGVTAYYDTTASDWMRIVRLTATATAAAGDVMYIVGEHTGAGATTTRTITMNDTASTDYGTGTAGAFDNGIEIGDAGILTFGTAATTNYTLKLSGSLNVYGNGILNIGTTGTPIPRGSTAQLLLDCGANVDFGLIINGGGTFNSQGLSRTLSKNIYYCLLNGDAAANATTLNVDTNTGWLDNDVIAVASTTRTASQCESGTLNGDAGASSLTVDGFAGTGGGVLNAHSGTSPTQAEVILLTRNVIIQGASATLQGYVLVANASNITIDVDWTEFKWMGSATNGKRGIDINSNSVGINFNYCSLHDFSVTSSIAFNVGSSGSNSWVFSNNVSYNINISHIAVVATPNSWTVDSNVFIRSIGNYLANLGDIGGTFTNNRIVSSGAAGVYLNEGGTIGSFSNNSIHSCGSYGLQIDLPIISSTLSNINIWRNSNPGILINGTRITDSTISDLTIFGNTNASISISGFSAGITGSKIINLISNGDSSFSTTFGIDASSGRQAILDDVYFFNADFSTVTGIKTAHTTDINFSNGITYSAATFNSSKLGGTNEIGTQSNLTPSSYISSEKHEQTIGNHKTWKEYGTITTDTTVNMYRTASPSERLTPNNASNKLVSGSKKIAVSSGTTVTPSVYVRESVVGDGTDYNGNRARLILKRNDAIGITADAVIATATIASEGSFEQLTGSATATGGGNFTDDGVAEFVVDCDGTTGWVNVDDWSSS